MSKLYFITHPSVAIIKDQSIDQWGLSDKGLEETERLLKLNFWDEIEAIHTSPEIKAVQVASLAAKKLGINIKVHECLSEVDRSSTGFVEFDQYMKLMENFYSHPKERVEGWESAEEATKRIVNCVSGIMETANSGTLAIIGHGATGTLLACHLLAMDPSYSEDPMGTGRYMVIDWDKKIILNKWCEY